MPLGKGMNSFIPPACLGSRKGGFHTNTTLQKLTCYLMEEPSIVGLGGMRP